MTMRPSSRPPMLARTLHSGFRRTTWLTSSTSAFESTNCFRRPLSLLTRSQNGTLQARGTRCWTTSPCDYSPQLQPVVKTQQRLKSGKAKAVRDEIVYEKPLIGDEPPIFDGKPALWARWAFVLLGLDILFIGFSVDMVMTSWTQPVDASPSPSSGVSRSEHDRQFVLRPIWQRLGLSAFEIAVGVAAGALILASRDRTVWRIRVRRVPLNQLPPSSGPGMRPPPASQTSSRTINVMSLESGSGRTKRYLIRDCTLSPGRDLSELFLKINGIRGHFVLGMNDARILGASTKDATESPTLKELALAKDANDIDALNAPVPGGKEMGNEHLGELRKGLARAWLAVGGTLSLPSRSSQTQGWTSGPLSEKI